MTPSARRKAKLRRRALRARRQRLRNCRGALRTKIAEAMEAAIKHHFMLDRVIANLGKHMNFASVYGGLLTRMPAPPFDVNALLAEWRMSHPKLARYAADLKTVEYSSLELRAMAATFETSFLNYAKRDFEFTSQLYEGYKTHGAQKEEVSRKAASMAWKNSNLAGC